MTTNATATQGAAFKRGDGSSSEGFVAIAEVNSIDGPNMSRETIDVTSLDSVGGYREFIPSFRDGGQVDLDMNFTQAGYAALLADFQSDSAVNYQIVWPDTPETTLDFAAYCINVGSSTPMGDKIQMKSTFKITGAVTMTS